MGCSASREGHDFIHPQNVSNSGPGPGPTPIARTLSLPTPLVHHRAVREGDSNHLVLLTSSTYGSLLLIDRPATIPNPKFGYEFGKSQNGSDPLEPLSPDSVVNTWELMEGLDDDFGFHLVESPKIPILESHEKEMLKSYEFVEHSDAEVFQLKGNEDRIVLYYTSLRGIRKTFEDCCDVRMIFRALRVCIDERDISMDSSYRKELQGVFRGKAVSLPQVFIRGRHIGGVNEIKQLNEAGELPKLLKGFPLKRDGLLCGSCGDARFMPCPSCNGSRKVFKNERGMLRRCPDCNENGLIRCPFCCP